MIPQSRQSKLWNIFGLYEKSFKVVKINLRGSLKWKIMRVSVLADLATCWSRARTLPSVRSVPGQALTWQGRTGSHCSHCPGCCCCCCLLWAVERRWAGCRVGSVGTDCCTPWRRPRCWRGAGWGWGSASRGTGCVGDCSGSRSCSSGSCTDHRWISVNTSSTLSQSDSRQNWLREKF